jgi:D-alanyl-D-alanine carboxypeptidase/D-alanyl-D-alanine-endopeptidase (penicillin-binding protein 4)
MRRTALWLCLAWLPAHATLPGGVARAFHEAGIPLSSVSVIVRESGQPQPLFTHDPDRPMNPASVMKVVTTYAALDSTCSAATTAGRPRRTSPAGSTARARSPATWC